MEKRVNNNCMGSVAVPDWRIFHSARVLGLLAHEVNTNLRHQAAVNKFGWNLLQHASTPMPRDVKGYLVRLAKSPKL